MDGVEAVACDMNSDFQEAFEEKCRLIQVVFDYFHIVKNFNDRVVGEVRKDEQKRLSEMDADHVSAWSKGGATDIANCQMLCRAHNIAKGNK